MSDLTTVELWFLDQSYKLGCPAHQQQELKDAGAMLEQKFQDMREASPRMINQKIAVSVALQLMQEVNELKRQISQYEACEEVIAEMVKDTEKALAD
ncbi:MULTISPECIES: cell division protein ZapA [unclassified Acinetobacter]|uniref:cell division protein ZapA n=1 Tax=unclassified Acinetobacter TaxID=196816 RepID=UPI0035B7C2D7